MRSQYIQRGVHQIQDASVDLPLRLVTTLNDRQGSHRYDG